MLRRIRFGRNFPEADLGQQRHVARAHIRRSNGRKVPARIEHPARRKVDAVYAAFRPGFSTLHSPRQALLRPARELRRVLNFTGRIFPSMAASVAIRLFSKVRIALGCCLVLGVALPCRSMAADPEALKADAEEFFRGRVTPFI